MPLRARGPRIAGVDCGTFAQQMLGERLRPDVVSVEVAAGYRFHDFCGTDQELIGLRLVGKLASKLGRGVIYFGSEYRQPNNT